MTRYRIENSVVTLLGFIVGAGLAMCITPGDIVLWVASGIVLGVFAHAFFIKDLAGELLWPFLKPRHPHEKKPPEPRPASPTR
jgi:hypothetical protein